MDEEKELELGECACCHFIMLGPVIVCPVCGLDLGAEPTERSRALRDSRAAITAAWTAIHAEAENGKARKAEMKACPDTSPAQSPVQKRLF